MVTKDGCTICEKHQHAKWHEYSDGEIINPIALLEMIESLPDCDAKNRMRSWVSFIAGIQWPDALIATEDAASSSEIGSLRSAAQK